MDNEGLNDLTEDGDELRSHRARARTELDQIARQAKHALAEHRIDLDLFSSCRTREPQLFLMAVIAILMTQHGNELVTSLQTSYGR